MDVERYAALSLNSKNPGRVGQAGKRCVMVAGEAQDEILGNMVFDIWGRLQHMVGAVISPKVGLPFLLEWRSLDG